MQLDPESADPTDGGLDDVEAHFALPPISPGDNVKARRARISSESDAGAPPDEDVEALGSTCGADLADAE